MTLLEIILSVVLMYFFVYYKTKNYRGRNIITITILAPLSIAIKLCFLLLNLLWEFFVEDWKYLDDKSE